MGKMLKQKEVIERFKLKHGNKYDYSKVHYNGWHYEVTIICPIHGEFKQLAGQHMRGRGCHLCANVRKGESNTNRAYTTAEWIAKAKKVNGDLYDYSKTVYNGSNKPITFKCNRCDKEITISSATTHLIYGRGCRSCNRMKARL